MKMQPLIFVALSIAAFAANSDDGSLLSKFSGKWQTHANAPDAPTKGWMQWQSQLQGKFVRLDYKIEWPTKDGGTGTFQGVAYYKVGGGEHADAFWADSSGDLHPITTERDGDALVAFWGVEGSKQGRTRYELLSENKMAVTDWLKASEGWRKFNHGEFTRVAD